MEGEEEELVSFTDLLLMLLLFLFWRFWNGTMKDTELMQLLIIEYLMQNEEENVVKIQNEMIFKHIFRVKQADHQLIDSADGIVEGT